MYVPTPKVTQGLAGPPPKSQPQAAVQGQQQAADDDQHSAASIFSLAPATMPTVPENNIAEPDLVPISDGPKFYQSKAGHMVNAKGDRVDEFGRPTHKRGAPGKERPSKMRWLEKRHGAGGPWFGWGGGKGGFGGGWHGGKGGGGGGWGQQQAAGQQHAAIGNGATGSGGGQQQQGQQGGKR